MKKVYFIHEGLNQLRPSGGIMRKFYARALMITIRHPKPVLREPKFSFSSLKAERGYLKGLSAQDPKIKSQIDFLKQVEVDSADWRDNVTKLIESIIPMRNREIYMLDVIKIVKRLFQKLDGANSEKEISHDEKGNLERLVGRIVYCLYLSSRHQNVEQLIFSELDTFSDFLRLFVEFPVSDLQATVAINKLIFFHLSHFMGNKEKSLYLKIDGCVQMIIQIPIEEYLVPHHSKPTALKILNYYNKLLEEALSDEVSASSSETSNASQALIISSLVKAVDLFPLLAVGNEETKYCDFLKKFSEFVLNKYRAASNLKENSSKALLEYYIAVVRSAILLNKETPELEYLVNQQNLSQVMSRKALTVIARTYGIVPNVNSKAPKLETSKLDEKLKKKLISVYDTLLQRANKDTCEGVESLSFGQLEVLSRVISHSFFGEEGFLTLLHLLLEKNIRNKVRMRVTHHNNDEMAALSIASVGMDLSRKNRWKQLEFTFAQDYVPPSVSSYFIQVNMAELEGVQTQKEFLKKIYIHFGEHLHLNGLLLLMHLSQLKYALFSKFEALINFNIRTKIQSLKPEALVDLLKTIKKFSAAKRYYSWFTAVESLCYRLLEVHERVTDIAANSVIAKQNDVMQILEGILGRNTDISFTENRMLDLKLDRFLSQNYNLIQTHNMPQVLQLLEKSGVSCPELISKVKKYVEVNYKSMPMSVLINVIFRLTLSNVRLDNRVYIHIAEETPKVIQNTTRHGLPMKYFMTSLMLEQKNLLKSDVLKWMFEKLFKIVENSYNEKERKLLQSETAFKRNLLLLIKAFELFHPQFYKSYLAPALKRVHQMLLNDLKVVKHEVEVDSQTFHANCVFVLKQILPQSITINENVWIYDGLLECDLVLRDTSEEKDCVIELHGPKHFLPGNTGFLSVNSEFKDRMKKKRYGFLVIVPFYEWYDLTTVQEKKDYLNYKLARFILKRETSNRLAKEDKANLD